MALRTLSYQEEIREIFKRPGSPSTNAMFGIEKQWVGRPREAVLGLPSRNCTPRRGVGSAFRACRLMPLHPGLEAPDFAKPTSRLAFWCHLPQHEGRHSFSDGGLGYSGPLRGRGTHRDQTIFPQPLAIQGPFAARRSPGRYAAARNPN